MNLDQGLEDLRERLRLMQGQATLILFLAPTEAATDENRRLLAEVLRIGGGNVVDLGRIGHESGPANWVDIMHRQPGDVFLLSAIPASVFGASAFASLVNAEREFLRKLPGPVLLVISRDTEDILRKRAPDFLTWASTVYDLPESSEFLAFARRLGAVPTSSRRHIQQEKPFRFLHLSDFHLRPSRVQRFDQERVLRGLVDFLSRDHERFPLDGIFITGDLGFSGKPTEYEIVVDFIKKLLAVTKVAPERTFVVPGNHDADRSVGEWLLRTLPNPEIADRFFLEERARDAHARKFAAYHEAMASVLGSTRKLGLGVGQDAIEMIDWDDARIAVAAFNSAWFAQADSDQGNLWIGEANIAEAGDKLAEENATFSVALMHHPTEWLDERERDIIEDRLERTFDVVLRGHLHKNRTRVIKSQRGGYVEVAGVAAYQTTQYPNGCYLGEIRPCARTVTLFPYRYGSGADQWVVDASVFPDDAATGHAHTFEVPPKRIAPAAIRRAREKAAVEVVRDMSPNMKQQMAQELGWHASARNALPREVEQRIARKAAAANEDEALWMKPEQAKKLEVAVGEAVADEAFANLPNVPKISRNGPDFLEEALRKVTPILVHKAATMRAPTQNELRSLLTALLRHAIDGPVSAWTGMGAIMSRRILIFPPDITIGTPNDEEFERAAVKFTNVKSLNDDLTQLVDQFETYLEDTDTHSAAIVAVTDPGSRLPEPRHEHRKSPKDYDILVTYLPIKLSQ